MSDLAKIAAALGMAPESTADELVEGIAEMRATALRQLRLSRRASARAERNAADAWLAASITRSDHYAARDRRGA